MEKFPCGRFIRCLADIGRSNLEPFYTNTNRERRCSHTVEHWPLCIFWLDLSHRQELTCRQILTGSTAKETLLNSQAKYGNFWPQCSILFQYFSIFPLIPVGFLSLAYWCIFLFPPLTLKICSWSCYPARDKYVFNSDWLLQIWNLSGNVYNSFTFHLPRTSVTSSLEYMVSITSLCEYSWAWLFELSEEKNAKSYIPLLTSFIVLVLHNRAAPFIQ